MDDNGGKKFKHNAPAYGIKKLSPAAKLALRATTLAAMSNKAAGEMSGISGEYISQIKQSTPGREYIRELENKLDEKTLDTTALLEKLGHEAIHRIGGLMRWSEDEAIVLRASQDLADRTPRTQKTHRHHVEAFTLSGKDAQALATAMVEAAELKDKFIGAVNGDYVRIPVEVAGGSGAKGLLEAETGSVREGDLPSVPGEGV